jgi:tRNA (guanine37-N1)-methyltransferase
MKIDVLTLFPNMFDGFLNESIIKRAIENKFVTINIHNIRDYSKDKHKKVDDYGFGGGAGMVLMPQPIFDAVDDLKTDDSFIILMTPQGKLYNQSMAYEMTEKKHIIIICGHYEGFDERIYTLADESISIGNFILTGGELPSMMISDAVIRLLDGVITDKSLEYESFNDNLLDYPVYTKPRDFRGMIVPEVLVSGDHKKINEFRESERKRITKEYRSDLLK